MIRCIILEDEKSAQEVLLTYIDKTPFIDCIGVYESGGDAPQFKLQEADLLFLDIELPELNGLSYLKIIQDPPNIIMTTANSNYTVDDFEQSIVDYLVKPFSYERFFKAINRVISKRTHEQKEKHKNLFLYADKTLYKVRIDDVLYVKAEGDYINISTEKKNILILDRLRDWNEKLQDFNFIQIHRSYIVNIDKVQKVFGNQVFIGREAIPIGKTYKERFLKAII